MGLSTVYEIVQQLHGFIKVKSKVGKGTTFYIYIPIMDKSEVTEQTTHDYSKNLTGSEQILVVEDNLRVRKFIQKLLVYN